MYTLIINGLYGKKFFKKNDAMKHAAAQLAHGEDFNGDEIKELIIREYRYQSEGCDPQINDIRVK